MGRQSTRHFAATIAWTIFAIPDMLLWRNVVALVSFMSVYAIIVSHWTLATAARAKEAVEDQAA